MELPLSALSFASLPRVGKVVSNLKNINGTACPTLLRKGNKLSIETSALPETLGSVAIAATVVGAAATLLVRRTKAAEEAETRSRTCEACSGSGICPECKGEGFVPKRLSEESAEKARLASKNMATRFTSGLPKKWSYCTKCSSSRSCIACGGNGKVNA